MSAPAFQNAESVSSAPREWVMEPTVYADALSQARPFAGDRTAHDRAWAVRVDTAVQGMDVIDAPGLDSWMTRHAAAETPHLLEAELVAAYESHIRALYADQPATLTAVETDVQDVAAVDVDADTDEGWVL